MKRLFRANEEKVLLLSIIAILLSFVHVGTTFGDTVLGKDVTYTTDADFNQGALLNVNHDDAHDQVQLNRTTSPFPFINVAASGRGTIVRIDVNTGQILGEYYTAPSGMGRDPSRTTGDLYGNVWVANRAEAGYSGNTPKGSITRVGLVVGGTRVNKDGTPNPAGQYLKPPFQYNTCVDKDGDGLIKTSRSLSNILPWSNTGQADTHGGVSTAEDECIINYTRVVGTGARTLAIDANNDVWSGGYGNGAHEKISGETGLPVPGTQFNLYCGGYGGLIDKNGVLWSSAVWGRLLRFDPKTMTGICMPPSGNQHYGLGIDPKTGNIWHTYLFGNVVAEIAPDGTFLAYYNHGEYYAQGVAVDGFDNVWVAHSIHGGNSVGHLRTDGTFVGNVLLPYGWGATGVAVDSNGKIWVTNYYSSNVMRIDPNAGPVGGGGYNVGAVDLVVDLGPGANPYNYSDMTGYVALGSTSPQGMWTITQDSGFLGNTWGRITWNTEPEGNQPEGTDIIIEARSSDTESGLASRSYISVMNGNPFLLIGRFIQVRVTLKPNASGVTPVLSDIRIRSSFANVRVIETISNNNIELDQTSFLRTPNTITSIGDKMIVEWDFNSFALDQQEDLSFDVILKSPLPGEDRLVNHKLEVLYTDTEGNAVRTELGPYYVHVLRSAFDNTITTDKPTYQANEDVVISTSIQNLSEYSRTVDAKIVIEDIDGVLLKEVATLTNLTFAAGEWKNLGGLVFNTAATFAGDYKAHLLLYENQKQVGEALASFTIEPTRAINSKATTDKMAYNANRPVTITSTIQSASPNYIFSGLVVRITLLNSQGTTLFSDTKTIPFLAPGQRVELKTYWNTSINPRGTYAVRLEVLEGISLLSTSATTFEILGSSQTSEGILGTITAQPNLLYQGQNEILSYSISNNGNEGISDLTVKVLIVDPDTQEVKNTLQGSLSLPMGTTSTGNFTASTTDLPPRMYLAILQASSATMTQPKTLASTVFMVIHAITLPFFDNFDSYSVGASAPAPWFELCEGQAVITGAESYSGQNSIMTGGPGNSNCAMVGLGETYPDRISYEVRAKVNLSGSSAFIGFFEEIVNMVPQFNTVYFNGTDGKVYFYSADRNHGFLVPLLDSFAVGVWYKVRVEIDFSILTADVYIDDVRVAQGLPVSPKEATWEHNGTTYNFQLNKIGVLHYLGEPFYFDDFSVFERRNHPPIADAGLNMAIFGNMQYSTVIQGMASDQDNDPMSYRWLEGQNELIPWRPVGPNGECYLDLGPVPAFALGEHILSLEVNDGEDISGDDMILTVNNSAPHPAPAGGGVCEINTQFPLKGQVSDYDGDIVNYGWSEGDHLLFGGSIQTFYGGTPVDLPEYLYQCLVLGEHTVSLSANDGVNQTVNAQIHISVTDASAPILAPAPDKNILWPPNHKMVTVSIQANARDNSGGPVLLSAVVSSNEPQNGLGDGDMSPDWTEPVIDQVNGVITLQLRAERSGSGNGRVYTIRVTATDTSGNSSYGDVNIIVPHDQGK